VIKLDLPQALQQGPQPFLFTEWFGRSRVRRWMEYERRNEYVARSIGPRPGRRVLDVGCDWGYACMCLARAGVEAWGVDIDQASIDFGLRLAEANSIRIRLGHANARSLPFADSFFDAIISIETIEHVPSEDRSLVFREMSRVLKPGGLIALSTPNPGGIAERAKRLLGRSPRLRRRFYGSYHDGRQPKVLPSGDLMVDLVLDKSEVLGLLRDTGLKLERTRQIVFVTKFLPEWLLAPAKAAEWVLERTPGVRRLGSTSVYIIRNQKKD
jgi:2-polyprenyl-3-methyl-5-hydroxy-6-metoxy-1,4-benzoquinol methylase